MMMYFNQITFIYFLWFFISIIYAFEVTGNNNIDIKWNGLPQMATFNNYEDMEKYIISSRKIDTIQNPTMDSYLTAYNLHHIEPNTKHNINKRSANPYDFIKFELADAKVPDNQTKELLKINRVREQKQINMKRIEEDSTGATIIFGNRTKTMNNTTKTKLIKRSDQMADIDDDDQDISESQRSINFYKPRINTVIKSKKSIKSFPHEVQKAINLVLLQENKQNNLISSGVNNNNIGLRYAPTHKQFYGDKILTQNYHGNYQNLQLNNNNNNEKLKYIYSPSQIPYNNYNNDGARYIAPYINLPSNNNEKQIISKTSSSSSVIIGNGIAPAPISALNSHLSEISDVHHHTLIQPQNIIKVEPSEINYVIQEVQPPTLSSSSSSFPEQNLAKPSISYNQYLSTPNILHNELLLHKSGFTPSSELQFNDVIINNNKAYSQENNNDGKNDDGNDEHQHQYKQFSYESFGDYEKQIIKEHNLFNGVNEQYQLTGKENNYNKDENDDGYQKGSSSSSNSDGNDKKYNILSSLIGKSPAEQLNGLTYLLENELHNNKNEQSQQQQEIKEINAIRPQDNRAPILFHPDNNVGAGIVGQGKNIIINKYGYKEVTDNNQQKDYKPITEAPEEIHSHHIVHITPSPLPAPVSTSFKQVQSIGLSPNYKNIDYEPKEYGMKLDDKELQYASKYTFGYRVRDFHTGNDFGHKQNRDHDGVTRGEYHILLPDGRVQNVRYHADDTGFHADVSFESGH